MLSAADEDAIFLTRADCKCCRASHDDVIIDNMAFTSFVNCIHGPSAVPQFYTNVIESAQKIK